MKNNYENIESMKRMQQEAIMRVQEMQKRAKKTLEVVHQIEPNINSDNISSTISSPIHTVNKSEPKKSSVSFSNSNIFDIFLKDTEKSLLLVLVLLLVEENSDIGLILALMYLIM